MNRPVNLSAAAGLAEDVLAVAWHTFETLPETHPLRTDFTVALRSLEDAIDCGRPVDAALVAVIQFVGLVSA